MARYFLMLKPEKNRRISGFARFVQKQERLDVNIQMEGEYNLYKANLIVADKVIYLGELNSGGSRWGLDKSLGIKAERDDISIVITDNAGIAAIAGEIDRSRAGEVCASAEVTPADPAAPPDDGQTDALAGADETFPFPATPGYIWQWQEWRPDYQPEDQLTGYVMSIPNVIQALRRQGYFLHSENGVKKALAIPAAFAFEPHPFIDLYDCACYLDGYWMLGINTEEKYFFSLHE